MAQQDASKLRHRNECHAGPYVKQGDCTAENTIGVGKAARRFTPRYQALKKRIDAR
jgi:hypothetical protein